MQNGKAMGFYSASVLDSIDGITDSLPLCSDLAVINKYASRIPNGLSIPCAVLKEIEIKEKSRDNGYGKMGLQDFDRQSKERGAVMALVRVGWTGDPILAIKANNLGFYKKTRLACNLPRS